MNRPFYSVTFGNKNTWDEWKLMPVKAGRIEFVTPNVKRETVDVAGSDGELDLSEVLTGYPTYQNRKGTLKFRFFDNGVPVRSRYTQLKNYLHGRTMRAVIEDDFGHYYEGRFMVGDLEWAKHGNWADTEISYDVKPYKLELGISSEDWLWDPFNFETGVIREYGGITLNPSEFKFMNIVGSRKPTVPKFIVSETVDRDQANPAVVELLYGENRYLLYKGTTIIPQILLMDDEYEMRFCLMNSDSPCKLSVEFRGGDL